MSGEAKLNGNHKRFIKARLNGKSNADAYIEAYKLDADKRDYASKAASRLMKNEEVSDAINRAMDASVEEAQATLTLAMSQAACIVSQIMEDGTKEDGNRLRAAEYIIDRGLGKPRTDVNLAGEIKGDITIVTAIQRPKDQANGNKSN